MAVLLSDIVADPETQLIHWQKYEGMSQPRQVLLSSAELTGITGWGIPDP